MAVCLLLILAIFVGLDLSFDFVPSVEAPTIYVDDDNTGPEDGSQANPWNTIQEGVDAAQAGDTVFVSNGTYYEDVYINKTINLTGISRDNTTINASSIGIFVENADYVNITGFTIENGSAAGIRLMPSNNSLVYNNRIERNEYGIQLVRSNNTIISDNIASTNSNYYAIYLDDTTNSTVKNNSCFNSGTGIMIKDESYNNIVINNNCSNNDKGILLSGSQNNYFADNILYSCPTYGIWDSSNGGNIYRNITVKNCWTGILVGTFIQDVQIFNSTIINSSDADIGVAGSNTNITVINTTFNKTKVEFGGLPTNLLIVNWYLHVNVIDYLGNPVPNANLRIKDNINGSYKRSFTTDNNGIQRWITITEYIERDTNGDTKGEKIFYTPHRIIAWNDTLVGYAQQFMNESKTITIVLYNGTLLDLEPGWNLVSLPRIQSDTNLQTVLQSIEGQYDAVQWYNVTDNNDQWKHYHISKPSFMNDLWKLNHTMGLWLHITDPQGTTLVVLGDEFTINQNISLYPGWNLVGFPSTANKTRDIALGALNFGSDIDSIWTYNSTMQKWIELDQAMDYFKIGQGYWMHSRVEDVWNVPL